MILAICIAIPLFFAGTAFWAYRYRDGKLHLVWGEPAALEDEEAIAEIERERLVRLDLDRPRDAELPGG